MKSLIIRIKKALRSKRGEMLMEAIVSIILLVILLTTITAMIATSRRLTANSMVEAREMQEETLIPVTNATHTGFEQDVTIEITAVDPSIDLEAEHTVSFFNNGQGLVAFFPEVIDP